MKALFEGLEIVAEKELCDKCMGNFLLISITLKEAVGSNFAEATSMLRRVIGKEAMRFLQKHYGRKTITLIDEYDVPLDYA